MRRSPPAIFCDTSVLVAALDAHHVHHGPCIALLGTLHLGGAYCALHSYAEVYAVMSGKPGKPRLRPSDVDAMIDRIDRIFTPITLTRREYRTVIQTNAVAGVVGGRFYDALILACAVKSDAQTLYTLNERDFLALAPATLAGKIRRP
ncbi:MAG TPA: PIN domain-containing protein [Gemmatimonadaceae bacterium]|jgi:predicted nucleic acid-binding protein|nr:PIN domain-containing protein [Gemmatimonadaceae bacterium]